MKFLVRNAYSNTGTVREPGEFAVRGGIVDLWPPGQDDPLRSGFFRSGTRNRSAASTQNRNSPPAPKTASCLLPASEAPLDPDSISRFRSNYVARFGAVTDDDPLYEAVSAGRKHPGMEHWLPLFYPHLDTLVRLCRGGTGLSFAQCRGSERRPPGTDRRLLRHARSRCGPAAAAGRRLRRLTNR